MEPYQYSHIGVSPDPLLTRISHGPVCYELLCGALPALRLLDPWTGCSTQPCILRCARLDKEASRCLSPRNSVRNAG